MRHSNSNRKFGLKRNGRRALLKSLARELFLRGKITTTDAKARELRPYAEKLISIARVDSVASRRAIASKLGNNPIIPKLFKTVAPKYKDRKGGYSRITKLAPRMSDGSKMAAIELI
jgi:large subunit ribosomal protein L17